MKPEVTLVTARCPVRTTLELLGGKWKLLLLHQLAPGPLRFADLKRRLPDISEKMLGQELKTLADSGLLLRIDYAEAPPRVEYVLTEKGKLTGPLLEAMRDFARAYETPS